MVTESLSFSFPFLLGFWNLYCACCWEVNQLDGGDFRERGLISIAAFRRSDVYLEEMVAEGGGISIGVEVGR